MGITKADLDAQRAMLARGEEKRKADWKQAERERLRDTFAAAALTGLLGSGDLVIDPCDGTATTLTVLDAYRWADAMLRERDKTNLDAVPEARADLPDERPPNAVSANGRIPCAASRDGSGTGNTQEPVAWAVMADDWFHDVRLSREGAEWYSNYLNNKAGKEKCRAVPLYRHPPTCPHVRGTVTQHCSLNFTLTDEEREAVEWAASEADQWEDDEPVPHQRAAALRMLLDRTKETK